LGFCCRQQSRR